ncbi:hypothetical protein V8C42DRAFT_314164 [Trichoderma barbatum]
MRIFVVLLTVHLIKYRRAVNSLETRLRGPILSFHGKAFSFIYSYTSIYSQMSYFRVAVVVLRRGLSVGKCWKGILFSSIHTVE